MVKPTLSEQVDELVTAVLARPDAPPPRAEAKFAPLAELAAALRHFPRPEFRRRLAAEWRGAPRRRRSKERTSPIRAGFHTVTPYVIVEKAEDLADFLKRSFGATETFRGIGAAGGVHAEVRIGDSMVMLGGKAGIREMPAALHLYVPDADSVHARAVAAGAETLSGPTDQPYGDREACVKDPFGNHWYIATHRSGRRYAPEGLRTVTPYLHPRGAGKLIEFLKAAFGAEVRERAASSGGVVEHAKLRIGDSIVEVGEAHGPWGPMPMMIHLYVPDADALYRSAMAAGAASISVPADQPYGDRVAGIRDPSGNLWYMATHQRDV
jgi:PhnB protein